MSDRITEAAIKACLGEQAGQGELVRPLSDTLRTMFPGRHGADCLAELMQARHERGIETYGESLSDADLDEETCAQHLAEELADALKYAIKLDEIRKAKEAAK